MDDAKQIFWGMLQDELYVQTPEVFLANRQGEDLLTTDGVSYHKPILSQPDGGTYTAHGTITPSQKSASKQTLTVDTFKWSADQIDDTDSYQTPYDLYGHSARGVREQMRLHIGQKFMDQLSSASNSIATSPFEVTSTNVLDALEEAEGKLGAIDAPYETLMRAIVFGPKTVAKLRRAKSDRESRLGDSVLANGVVGPWQGWTVVQSNNLPYSAVLTMATNPTDGDTVTIAGVTFEFQDDLADVADGNVGVLRDASAADTSRAALAAAINDSGTEGTTYTAMSNYQDFVIRKKRNITATNNNSADTLTLAGYGDISVSETFTAAGNVWGSQQQTSVFMIRGAIDLVVQFMQLETTRRETGFGDIIKGLVGIGASAFDDGARLMVKMTQDASNF